MSPDRVLLIGYGAIGREVYADWSARLPGLMVHDTVAEPPDGARWDGNPVDVAVVCVDTPADGAGGLAYRSLAAVVDQALSWSGFVLVRSTVGPDFLDHPVVRAHQQRVGFAPEFYGTTRHSRRGVLTLDFGLFSDNVPEWLAAAVTPGVVLRGAPVDVVLAKLAENAFLATKVTFFHDLALLCREQGADFDTVRLMVTADPRIGAGHSYLDGGPGWSSHCLDKDVPAFAALAGPGSLVASVLAVNAAHRALAGDRQTHPA